MSDPLPRGVWFEEARSRYRIRKYRNGKAFIQYRTSVDEALEEFESMAKRLKAIPKLARGERAKGIVPIGSFAGLMAAAHASARH